MPHNPTRPENDAGILGSNNRSAVGDTSVTGLSFVLPPLGEASSIQAAIGPSSPEIIRLAEAFARAIAEAMMRGDASQMRGDASHLTDKPMAQPPAPILTTPNGEQLLTTQEAAGMLGLSRRTLEGFRLKGGGPPYKQLGGRTVRYQADELRAWIASRSAPHTAKAREIFKGR